MTHIQIIDSWPNLSAFASDIGVEYGTAKAMRRRGSIPAKYWNAAVNKASGRKIKGVTLSSLAKASAPVKERATA